jgi:alpha-ketoglutarate-dependent 2,4-dichlorophenoxyacetate dioxygenase
MTVLIRQLHPHFIGEVSGVDLRKPLTKQEAIDIEAGMDKYAVLIFHGQDITDEQQLAFALNFGEREQARERTVTKKEDYRLTSGSTTSQSGKDGKPLPKDHRPSVQSRQLPVAFRQPVPPHPAVLAVVGAW